MTGAVVGARHPDQISNLINAAEFRPNEREMREIDDYLHMRRKFP
ncbi:MAG TPA: hypothetical protein VKV40_07675 [Ktedonobacteraceae bacterium]|nr:hypothetical protein [Ktedonobacteraceae bacterium]